MAARRVWYVGVVLVLVLLAGAALLLSRLAPGGRLPPSGDAFFDEYAGWIWQDYQARLQHDHHAIPGMYVPLSVLSRWEPKWGRDPRYWELRSECAQWEYGHTHRSTLPANPTPQDYEKLATQIETAQTQELLTGYARGALSARGALVLWLHSQKDDRATQERYLNLALKLDPQYPWAWYCRALHELNTGDKAKAEADFAAGNKLPAAPFPKPFPDDIFEAALLTGKPVAATKVYNFVYTSGALSLWIRNAVVLNISAKDYPAHARLLTEIHKFAASMYRGDRGSLMNALMALAISGWVTKSITEYSQQQLVSPAMLDMLSDDDGLQSRMSALGTNLLKNSTSRIPTPNGGLQQRARFEAEVVLDKFIPGRGISLLSEQQRDEAQYTATRYAPYFEALALMDFEHPARSPQAIALLKQDKDPYASDTWQKKMSRLTPKEIARRRDSRDENLRDIADRTYHWLSGSVAGVRKMVTDPVK